MGCEGRPVHAVDVATAGHADRLAGPGQCPLTESARLASREGHFVPLPFLGGSPDTPTSKGSTGDTCTLATHEKEGHANAHPHPHSFVTIATSAAATRVAHLRTAHAADTPQTDAPGASTDTVSAAPTRTDTLVSTLGAIIHRHIHKGATIPSTTRHGADEACRTMPLTAWHNGAS